MSKYLLVAASAIAFAALGINATSSIGSEIIAAKEPNCDNPRSQAEMNQCAYLAYQDADEKLNQVYQQVIKQLSSDRQKKLVKAQQMWIKFRDTNCEFEKSEVEGGSMAPQIYHGCLARVTEERTKQLESYLPSP